MEHTFVKNLRGYGIHRDIALKIWQGYLLPFDRWMVYMAHKFESNKYMLESTTMSITAAHAAKHGYLEILKLIHAYGGTITGLANEKAAFGGHIHIIEWLCSIGISKTKIFDGAAKGGQIKVFEWIKQIEQYEPGFHVFPYILVCRNAAKYGHLDALKWAHLNGYYWLDPSVGIHATRRGDLAMLQWAHQNKYPLTAYTCRCAASNGQLEILKWLRQNECPWNKRTCAEAAYNGHLEVLKWAYENGCPWDDDVCFNAAYNGHLEVLKWARHNGFSWTSSVRVYSARNGHTELLQWAIANGCPDPQLEP